MNTLLAVSIALLAGLLMTRIFRKAKLPAVTAYLIAGVLIGPFCLGSFGIEGLGFNTLKEVESLAVVSELALGFIAFSIGSEFRVDDLKRIGKQAFTIGIFQALVATLLVDLSLWVVHLAMPEVLSVPQLITLGAIATATAPAATLMVVREYKAKGPLTQLLLPIVALDDAVGLVVFAVSFGIAKGMVAGGAMDLVSIIVNPLIEIALSLVLGAVMGWILTQLEKMFHSNTNRLNMTIAMVALTTALSSQINALEIRFGSVHIGTSSLLVCMMLGTIFCNICPLSEDMMQKSDKWTSPLFALFFVISGAELELSVFAHVAIVGVGVVYIVFRCLGKYFGAMISAKATKCEPSICKYLGITLFPQAGVALGMCKLAMELGESQGRLIQNITLFAILIYEIFGPLMTKWALTKAGDIQPISEEVKNRRQKKLEEVKRVKEEAN